MIVAISGKRGAGKNAIADVLVKEFGFWRIGLADPMKRFLLHEEVFTKEQLFGPSENREEVDIRWGKSARQALQTLGTEWGRGFCETLWVQILIRDAQRIQQLEGKNIVVTDIRYPNELAALDAAGARLVRVRRPALGTKGRPFAPEDVQALFKSAPSAIDTHTSETSLDDVPDDRFDNVLRNDGTLEDLHEKVRMMARFWGMS